MKTTLLCLLLLSPPALAAPYNGSISYTDTEIAEHARGIHPLMKAAASCLQRDLARHREFIQKYKVSAFYGDNSAFAKKKIAGPGGVKVSVPTSAEDKRGILRSYQLPESLVQQLIPRQACPDGTDSCPLLMQPTSCIGLTLKCLGEGFEAAGQDEIWQKARRFVLANNARGDTLLMALQELGWSISYWNPDTRMARNWDLDEQLKYPGNPKHIWGQHEATWRSVSAQQRYYLNTVDDYRSLINFGNAVPARVRSLPFFVGLAHLGYHVFPGSFGQIIEAHSTRAIHDPETVESSPFAPLSPNGGPRGGPYKSGIAAIPPGF